MGAMMSRRNLVVGGGAAAAAAAGLWAFSSAPDYDAAAAAIWRHQAPADGADAKYLVHYATLAANSHNSQPWRFRTTAAGMTILPDLSRALPVVDPDNHHLHVSLGCAAENALLAARAAGRSAEAAYLVEAGGRVELAFGPRGVPDPLFEAIPARQCTRSDYDGRTVRVEDIALLRAAARIEGCELLLIHDRRQIERVLELVLIANTAQVSDPAFTTELKGWLRFNARAAMTTRDGLYSGCSGNPPLPTWLGRIMFGAVFKPQAESDRYARQVRSSSGLAVIVSEHDDPAHRIAAGRAYQRFALQATTLGIRHAHLNQPVEMTATRPQLAALLGIGARRPDLVLRYGYAPSMPRSLRRPLAEVMVA